MITDEQRTQFREEGYFILPEFFSAAEIDELRAHIDRFAEAHEKQLQEKGKEGISRPNEISFTAWLTKHDPEIMRFVAQEKFAALTSDLLNDDIELYWEQSVYKKPETKREFPWHQDTGYIHTDPAEYVTCWLALDDVPLESGCIWIIPRSHHQGLVEHKPTEIGLQCYFGEETGIPVPLKKGGMAVFSSLLFHRSGPNLSDKIRKGYVVQYCVVGSKNADTGEVFADRPVIARGGKAVAV